MPIGPSGVTDETNKPNPAALKMPGLGAVAGSSAGHLALGSLLSKELYAAHPLQQVTGASPLALISNRLTFAERPRWVWRQIPLLGAATVCLTVGIVRMHLFFKSLDLRWLMLLLQLELYRPMASVLHGSGGLLWSA